MVAPTDAQAEALGRPNYAVWYANLTKLWRDFGSIPVRFARDFDEARQRGIAIAGTPARVREEIERQVAASGCTYFVVRLMFANMAEAEAGAAIDLFASEVMPHLAEIGPRDAAGGLDRDEPLHGERRRPQSEERGAATPPIGALVDTGSELTWLPADVLRTVGIAPRRKRTFAAATKQIISRDVGYAILSAEGYETTDEVVFAEPGDTTVLGRPHP